ncbi:biopolymer transport protein ExbD/TolR [Melioribacter roseus P3M-2]|uniref:Biopolymer transport protein ExbD/TolR n=1 Tax=Melioribacter roseus (strain DSM 23840 / JCM 17771 / VKM B-2668 / P3M-2) TaxID=1191523 RepID=I6Z7U0_MELRP|nr:biopolymer transporter ExbD [Melioribacter roseus]AFN75230.1 biopolymer transport protein ExbD/TolR [Melioribacter roseus P3M-2]
MKFETNNKPLSIFAYSSLTDIVMLLLIFFLLTSQFVIQTGVKIKLPSAKNNEQVAPAKLIVTITEGNQSFLGDEEISIERIAGRLDMLKRQTNESNLIIRADKSVNIDLIIKIIDAAKGVGIDKFTIETEKAEYE